MDVGEVVEGLLVDPVHIDMARATLPERGGVYAWWTDRGAIPGVPLQPHPSEEALDLFYIGIAPRDAKIVRNPQVSDRGQSPRGKHGFIDLPLRARRPSGGHAAINASSHEDEVRVVSDEIAECLQTV